MLLFAMIFSSCLLFLLQPAAVAATKIMIVSSSLAWQFRSATNEDVAFARKTMMQQAMNPLSISKERLLVAYDDDDEQASKSNGCNLLLGFGQIRPLDDSYSELASLYVLPNQRGKGIGGALIQELLSRHDDDKGINKSNNSERSVVLLTLRPTTPLYEKYGFEIVENISEMPMSLQLEYKAGSIVSAFLGNDLVCMKRMISKKSI
jgi:ribosomal protein S18 acetylase RimI-like enzyme